MTVFCSHKFPLLSLSLNKSVSVSIWTPLLTCPEDIELPQLYSRVGKPDVQVFCDAARVLWRKWIDTSRFQRDYLDWIVTDTTFKLQFALLIKKSDENYLISWCNLLFIYLWARKLSRCSDWATCLTVRDRIPVGTRFSTRPDRPWGPPSLL